MFFFFSFSEIYETAEVEERKKQIVEFNKVRVSGFHTGFLVWEGKDLII